MLWLILILKCAYLESFLLENILIKITTLRNMSHYINNKNYLKFFLIMGQDHLISFFLILESMLVKLIGVKIAWVPMIANKKLCSN